jgi:hypothetical protein
VHAWAIRLRHFALDLITTRVRLINRFSKGQRGLCGQHLYEHFFEEGHSGLKDFKAQLLRMIVNLQKGNFLD